MSGNEMYIGSGVSFFVVVLVSGRFFSWHCMCSRYPSKWNMASLKVAEGLCREQVTLRETA